MEAILDATEFKPAEGLLDNTQIKAAATSPTLRCRAAISRRRRAGMRTSSGRSRCASSRTGSRSASAAYCSWSVIWSAARSSRNPRAYPRHHGLTFLRMEEFSRLKDHLVKLGVKFLQRPTLALCQAPLTSIRR